MGKASRKKPLRHAGEAAAKGDTAAMPAVHSSGGVSALLRGLLDRPILQILLIAVIGLLAYSNTFDVPFILDDIPAISENPIIHDIGNFIRSTKGYTYSSPDYNPRRSLGFLTFALNYHFGGLDVMGYHAVNLLIHLSNGILVYLLVILTFRTPYFTGNHSAAHRKAQDTDHTSDSSLLTFHSSRLIALFSALLFVSHPVQTQAVTYVVQRFTSLAMLFYLLSLILYARAGLAGRLAGRLAGYGLSLLCALAALRTKEITVTLPVVILLYEFLFFSGERRRKVLTILLLLILSSLLIFALGFMNADMSLDEIIRSMDRASRVQAEGSRWVYFMTEMRVIVTYIRLIFLPTDQRLDYDFPIQHTFFSPAVILPLLFLSSLLGFALYLLYKSRQADRPAEEHSFHDSRFTIHYVRLVAFGILWFFIALSVESSFIPIADVIFEHRMYLPSVGLFIALVTAAMTGFRKYRPNLNRIVLAFSCAVILLSVATFARNSIWQSPLELWADTAKKSPGLIRPLYNLGNAYATAGNFEKAIETYERAIQLPQKSHIVSDQHAQLFNNLGSAYGTIGKYNEAIQIFTHVLKNIDARSSDAAHNLGVAYLNTGRYHEAIDAFRQAIHIKPDHLDAHGNLALAYRAAGENDKAFEEYAMLKNLSPERAAALLPRIQDGR